MGQILPQVKSESKNKNRTGEKTKLQQMYGKKTVPQVLKNRLKLKNTDLAKAEATTHSK